jgi:hypothetical protein
LFDNIKRVQKCYSRYFNLINVRRIEIMRIQNMQLV